VVDLPRWETISNILAEAAELAQEIDIKRAERPRFKPRKLKACPPMTSQFSEVALALKRATNRIKVSARKT